MVYLLLSSVAERSSLEEIVLPTALVVFVVDLAQLLFPLQRPLAGRQSLY